MIVVGVEKTFENGKGLALVDRRDWVFRPQLSGPPSSQSYSDCFRNDDALLPLSDSFTKVTGLFANRSLAIPIFDANI